MKHVNVNALCTMCNIEAEIIAHALIFYSFSRSCWDRIGINVTSQEHSRFADWLQMIIDQYGGKEIDVAVMLSWSL